MWIWNCIWIHRLQITFFLKILYTVLLLGRFSFEVLECVLLMASVPNLNYFLSKNIFNKRNQQNYIAFRRQLVSGCTHMVCAFEMQLKHWKWKIVKMYFAKHRYYHSHTLCLCVHVYIMCISVQMYRFKHWWFCTWLFVYLSRHERYTNCCTWLFVYLSCHERHTNFCTWLQSYVHTWCVFSAQLDTAKNLMQELKNCCPPPPPPTHPVSKHFETSPIMCHLHVHHVKI